MLPWCYWCHLQVNNTISCLPRVASSYTIIIIQGSIPVPDPPPLSPEVQISHPVLEWSTILAVAISIYVCPCILCILSTRLSPIISKSVIRWSGHVVMPRVLVMWWGHMVRRAQSRFPTLASHRKFQKKPVQPEVGSELHRRHRTCDALLGRRDLNWDQSPHHTDTFSEYRDAFYMIHSTHGVVYTSWGWQLDHVCIGFIALHLWPFHTCDLLSTRPKLSLPGVFTHTHTHSHTLTHTHTQSHTSTHTQAHTITHRHSHTHSHTHQHTSTHQHTQAHMSTHRHSHTLTHTLTHTSTHSHTLTHTLTLIHIHKHTRAHTHTDTHTRPLLTVLWSWLLTNNNREPKEVSCAVTKNITMHVLNTTACWCSSRIPATDAVMTRNKQVRMRERGNHVETTLPSPAHSAPHGANML